GDEGGRPRDGDRLELVAVADPQEREVGCGAHAGGSGHLFERLGERRPRRGGGGGARERRQGVDRDTRRSSELHGFGLDGHPPAPFQVSPQALPIYNSDPWLPRPDRSSRPRSTPRWSSSATAITGRNVRPEYGSGRRAGSRNTASTS